MLTGRKFDVAQDLLDVDGVAEIATDIFAEALHGKIFIQMPERANIFRLTEAFTALGARLMMEKLSFGENAAKVGARRIWAGCLSGPECLHAFQFQPRPVGDVVLQFPLG